MATAPAIAIAAIYPAPVSAPVRAVLLVIDAVIAVGHYPVQTAHHCSNCCNCNDWCCCLDGGVCGCNDDGSNTECKDCLGCSTNFIIFLTLAWRFLVLYCLICSSCIYCLMLSNRMIQGGATQEKKTNIIVRYVIIDWKQSIRYICNQIIAPIYVTISIDYLIASMIPVPPLFSIIPIWLRTRF